MFVESLSAPLEVGVGNNNLNTKSGANAGGAWKCPPYRFSSHMSVDRQVAVVYDIIFFLFAFSFIYRSGSTDGSLLSFTKALTCHLGADPLKLHDSLVTVTKETVH